MNKIVVTLIIWLVILSVSVFAQDAPLRPNINTLSWLAGNWKGDFEGNPYECYYTTPKGGTIISVSKEFPEGRPCFIEFEKFTVVGDSIVLTPYPDGKKSDDFILTDYDPNVKKAKFVNYKHDFPNEIIYELVNNGNMIISVAGDQKGKWLKFKVKLHKID